MSLLLSFSGKIGSGKDYIITNFIIPYLKQHKKSYIILSFANYLKQKLYIEHNVDYNKLYIHKDEDTRKLLQMVGDELRQKDKDVFIKSVYVQILNSLSNYDVIILSDTRFKNEKMFLETLKEIKTITVKIVSPNRTKDKMTKENSIHLQNHRSETELDDEKFDYVLNNDYQDNVIDDIYQMLNYLMILNKTESPWKIPLYLYVKNHKELSDTSWVVISRVDYQGEHPKICVIDTPHNMTEKCPNLTPPLNAICVGDIRNPYYSHK